MKTKLLTSLLIVTVLVCTLAFAASAATVTISTPEELLTLMNEGYTMSDTFVLAGDIDLSQTEGQTPIGTSGKKFTGTFDGKGYTISGINITSSTDASYPYIGLFGLAQGATIKNLTVEGTVSGASYVGGIVAWCRGATIINCTNKVNVTTSGANAGGILGYGDYNLTTGATLTISGCKNEGTVTATGTGAGGIYGCASLNGNNGKTYIQNCVNEGAVSASGRAGGILGITGTTAKTGTVIEITGCKNYGAITITTGNVVGGIMGYYMGRATSGDNIFKIHQCENYGTIAANSQTSGQGGYVGGILGAALETGNKYALDITLTELYNNGKLIRGTSQPIGAIVSYLRIPLTETVDGKQIASLTMSDWVNDCDWKGDTTSWMIYTIPDAGIVSYFGMTNIVNNAGSRIFSVDSDLSGELVVGTNNHVNFTNCISTNSTAAEKAAFVAANSDKYMMDGDNVSLRSTLTLDTKIGSAEEMALLMATPSAWDKAYTLECDIDISGIAQSPIGNSTTPFTGSFDGKSHAITGLNISVTTTGGGLFGYTKDATIQNLTVSGSVTATTSTGSRAGGLIGEAQGDLTVSGCTINVTVNAEAGAAGGVVGTVNSGVEKGTVSISNTTSTGNVTGSKYTAGFIGYALGAYDTTITLTNCKNTGNITSSDSGSAAGGIVGYLIPSNAVTYTFKNCENTGAISGYNYNGGILALVGSPSAAANRSNFNFVFDGCINRGSVTTTAGNVSGGILGYYNNTKSTGDNTITIKNSVNYGAITSGSTQSGGGTYPGGIVGAIGGSSANTAYLKAVTISNCANFGAVSGKSYKGSIAGVLRPSNGTAYVLENLYSSAAAEVPAFGEFGKNSNAENLSTFSLNGIYNMGYDTNMVGTLNSNSVSRKECYAKNSTIREVYNLADNEAWVMTTSGPMLSEFATADDLKVDYSIDSVEDYLIIVGKHDSWSGDFTLEADIDLCGIATSPIGNSDVAFTGTFDGKSHTISGLNVQGTKAGTGFFGVVSDDGDKTVIKNFTIKGTVTNAEHRFVGGFVGIVCGETELDGLNNYTTVTSGYFGANAGRIGGIVGGFVNNNLVTSINDVDNDGDYGLTVKNCANYGKIEAKLNTEYVYSDEYNTTPTVFVRHSQARVGGIIGSITPAYETAANKGSNTILIENCRNYGEVKGVVAVGGIAGVAESSKATNNIKITKCSNYGDVYSVYAGGSDIWFGTWTGGIVGYANLSGYEAQYVDSFEVSYCYNEGEVSAPNAHMINSQLAQKFVDEDDIVTDGEGVEDDSTTETTTSSVENRAQVGGIVGYAYGGYGNHVVTIKACYNNGLVWANGNDVAGIVGIANSAHVYDCYNTGVVESTFIDTKAETRTYGRYVGGIIGRLAGDLNKFERNFNKGETVSTGGSGYFGVGGGYNAYPHFYSNNFYYSDLTTNDKNAAKISDSQLGDYSVFTGINESDEWIYTVYGPELKYFHTCENTEKIVTTEANCNTKEVYNETCRCLETVYARGVIGEIAADKHAYEESAWQANAGAYEFKCKRCGTVKATAETPFVYVDAYTHISAFVGNDKNDGTTPETAVYSLEEAVRRLSATGGKAIICDRYYLGKDGALEVNLPAYEKTVTITTNLSAEGKVVTGFATVTNGVHFNLGGPTKFENIIFNGSDTVKNSSDSGYYKIPVICANWNNVEFGEGISSFGAAYFVAGKCYHDSFKVPASRNDAAKTQELIFSKITAIDIKDANGNKLQNAVTFFSRVYLGDRVRDGALDGDITSYTVANKTISATFNRTTVVDLYAAAAVSPENINAQMENINTTVNLNGDAYVRYLHTGDGNTDGKGNGTAYMDKLTVNVNDNARVYGAWAFENIRDLTVNISAEEDGRSNDYGIAARLFVTKSEGYTPTGAEKAAVTYGSHSFKKGTAKPAYNAMYTVSETVKDDCDFGGEVLDLVRGVYVKECSFCGAESTRKMPDATALGADSYKYGISVTLANELLVEYLVQMDADNVYDEYYLVIKHYADGAKTPEAETVIPHTVNKSGTKNVYRFYAPGVAAKEMSDRVVATFYAVENDEIFVASEYERNIIDYYNMAYSAYGSATDGQAYAFMNVLNALLNYGAEAQRYFRYNEDSLANATIPADKQKTEFEADANATISVDENDVENDVYTVNAFYPILEERVVMAISFNLVGEAVSNLAFKGSYTDINGNAKTVLVGGENIIVNETQVLVRVDSVAAKDLRQMITGALYSGDTQVSDSISFSFECYAAAADTAEQNICNAILNYCDAAKALFAKSAVSE